MVSEGLAVTKPILCYINGDTLAVFPERGVRLPKRATFRPIEAYKSLYNYGNLSRNRWPWKSMQPGECVTIPWGFANIAAIINSINGYQQYAKGSKFIYRSTIDGLMVWCKKQSKKNRA